tara:strand:+ start:260 stop:541 length:282 start_codon:yes stop_codon:yes gene_type:complete
MANSAIAKNAVVRATGDVTAGMLEEERRLLRLDRTLSNAIVCLFYDTSWLIRALSVGKIILSFWTSIMLLERRGMKCQLLFDIVVELKRSKKK